MLIPCRFRPAQITRVPDHSMDRDIRIWHQSTPKRHTLLISGFSDLHGGPYLEILRAASRVPDGSFTVGTNHHVPRRPRQELRCPRQALYIWPPLPQLNRLDIAPRFAQFSRPFLLTTQLALRVECNEVQSEERELLRDR